MHESVCSRARVPPPGRYVERTAVTVHAFLPGAKSGAAVAGLLFGRVNRSGKLPVQVPSSATSGPQPTSARC